MNTPDSTVSHSTEKRPANLNSIKENSDEVNVPRLRKLVPQEEPESESSAEEELPWKMLVSQESSRLNEKFRS